ncbi:MAG TPA: pyruvate ferredoxin oxidoreductase [Spirochaetes bacterium]|nr:pyruvate ferredoxin oxidoreductase [Spirochaetota bacterium]
MYAVARVTEEDCTAEKGCRLCIVVCPEPDTIDYDPIKKVAVVNEERCKGCILCIAGCSVQKCIVMVDM